LDGIAQHRDAVLQLPDAVIALIAQHTAHLTSLVAMVNAKFLGQFMANGAPAILALDHGISVSESDAIFCAQCRFRRYLFSSQTSPPTMFRHTATIPRGLARAD
jgi:hypothetical protein